MPTAMALPSVSNEGSPFARAGAGVDRPDPAGGRRGLCERRPPKLGGHPMLTPRPLARGDRALHQFPQPGPLERRAPATISFSSPKLSRNASLPGSLPRPPYVAASCGRWMPLTDTSLHRRASKYNEPGMYSSPLSSSSSRISPHRDIPLVRWSTTLTSRKPVSARRTARLMRSYIHWCVSPRRLASPSSRFSTKRRNGGCFPVPAASLRTICSIMSAM